MGHCAISIRCNDKKHFCIELRDGYAEAFILKRNEVYTLGPVSFYRKDQDIYTIEIDGLTSKIFFDHKIVDFPTTILVDDNCGYNSCTSGIWKDYKKVNQQKG